MGLPPQHLRKRCDYLPPQRSSAGQTNELQLELRSSSSMGNAFRRAPAMALAHPSLSRKALLRPVG
jgi:hypothetical protein